MMEEEGSLPWMKRVAVGVLLLLLLGSVGLWLVSRVEVPTAEVRQVSVQIPVNNQAQVQVQVSVSNTLGVPLSYLGADVRLALGRVTLMQGRLETQGTVAAGARSLVLLPLTVDLSRIKEASAARAAGEPATISGGLHVMLGKKRQTIPFAFTRRLSFGGSGVTSRVTSAQIHLLERGRARVRATLELTNPLDQPLRSPGTDYRVLLDGKEVARGSMKTAVQIPARGKGPAELTVDVDLPRRAARPRSLTVLATLRASLGGRSVRVPVRLHKELSGLPGSSSCSPGEVYVDMIGDTMKVEVTLTCRGQATGALRSATVRFRALLAGVEVASGTVNAAKVRREGIALHVKVPLTVKLAKLRAAQKAASGGAGARLVVRGLVVADLGGRVERLPFELTRALTPSGMRCQLEELAVSSWGGKLRLAPRLRITSSEALPAVESMEVTYAATLDGQRLGAGAARLTGHQEKKELRVRAELALDQAGLRARRPGATRLLRVSGQVLLRASGKVHRVPYTFSRLLAPGGKAAAVALRGLAVESPAKDRLVLTATLAVRSQSSQVIRNISARYSAHALGTRLAAGTFRLARLGAGRTGLARVRLEVDPTRLQKLRERAVGRRMVLVLRGVLTATLPNQSEPLRVPFVVARPLRPGKAGDTMTVTVESVRVHKLSDQGLDATIRLGLEGQTARLGKASATYQVLVARKVLVKGALTLAPAAGGAWTADIPLSLNTGSLAALRGGGATTAPVVIKGSVTGKVRGRALAVPFLVRRTVPLGRKRPLDVSIKAVTLDARAAGKVEVDLLLALRSRLEVDLRDLDASYVVTAGKAQVLRGTFMLRALPAGGKGQARIPLTIKTAALKAMSAGGGTVPLIVTGRVAGKIVPKKGASRSFNVPFTVRKEMTPGGKPLEAEVIGTWIKEISDARVKLLLKLRLRGGALGSARNVNVDFAVEAYGQQILAGKLKLEAPAPGKSVVAELPLTVESARVRQLKKKRRGKKFHLTIRGTVTGTTTRGGTLKIPFVVHKKAALLARPVTVKLHKLDFSGMSPSNRTFRAILEVTNRAPFTIKNLNIEGTIRLARGVEGRVLNRNVTIASGQTTRLTVAIKTKRGGILRLIAQRVRGKRANSQLKLKVTGKTEDGATITSTTEQKASVSLGK